MENSLFQNRREKLLERIKDDSIVILFSGEKIYRSADQEYPFSVNRNFYYLTGIDKPNIAYLAYKRDGKVVENIFVERIDEQMEKWVGKKMRPNEAKEISGVKVAKFEYEFESMIESIMINFKFKRVYLDLERRRFDESNSKSNRFAAKLADGYKQLDIVDSYFLVAKMRMVKDAVEIDKIKKAIDITKDGVESLMSHSKADIREDQLEAYFDFELKTKGATGHAFKTIAAAGQNATILHYEDNNTVMKDGDLILFDLGAEYEYYCADISRTFPVNGKFTDRQKEIYNIVLKAQLETIKAIKPGKTTTEINEVTKSVLTKECKRIGLIKEDAELFNYYFHGVSHSLGLDTHDVGERSAKLKAGAVITVEPGLYIPEENIGIRIEDDVVLTKDGCENLSSDILKTVEEIENFMSNKK